jgi:hypothetical protein
MTASSNTIGLRHVNARASTLDNVRYVKLEEECSVGAADQRDARRAADARGDQDASCRDHRAGGDVLPDGGLG